MEKVLDIVKGLFAGLVEFIMHPVSKVTEIVQREDIKKGAIKAVILAAVLAIVNVLSTIRVIHIYNTKSSMKDAYMEALNPFVALLKSFGIYLLIIVAVALVLFVISKLVKDQKSLPYTLSMTVNSAVVYAVGITLGLVLSFWTPLSVLVITLASLHSGLTLLVTFMSSLSNVNTDQLVLVAAVVLIVVSVILALIDIIANDKKLSSYADSEFSSTTQYNDLHGDALKNITDIEEGMEALSSLSNLF